MKQLIKIQSELKAPKNQFNKFGNYKYRNCEDILEALKPILLKHGAILTISDEIKDAGNIIYCEATAKIQIGEDFKEVKAQAGINPDRKGMDIAQSFGSSSSYARKYALNGLFLIDDTKDADTMDNSKVEAVKPNIKSIPPELLSTITNQLTLCDNIEALGELFKVNAKSINEYPSIKGMFTAKKQSLQKEVA